MDRNILFYHLSNTYNIICSLPLFLSASGVTPFQKGSKKSCYSAIIACAFTVNQQPFPYYLIFTQKTHNQRFFDSVKYKVVLK